MTIPSSYRNVIMAALFALFLLPIPDELHAQSVPAAPTGCAAMLERWRSIAMVPLPEWRVHPFEGVQGAAPELDDSAWGSVKMWTWPKEAGTSWFRRWVEIPASRGGYDLRNSPLRFRAELEGEYPIYISIYVNGVVRAQGYYLDPLLLTGIAEPGQKILIALKADTPAGKIRLQTARLEFGAAPGRPDARMLLESCTSAELLNAASGEGKEQRAQQIESARNAIEWAALERNPPSAGAFDDSLRRAQEKLEPLRGWLESFSIRAVGNAHIDMAWLWPWTETVEVTRNTFSSVLNLMQEYPDFTFTHGSPSNYAWMEEKYPSLFEQIRRRVKEGRWEVIGGMWVESDQNLPDGESFTRQLLHGKRYFQEKFGVDVRTGWTPDSFGYNWQLPQIYKKSGIDFFVTQKIGWNDTTKFPHKLFWWEGLDGSRVLTYFPRDYVNPIEPVAMARALADQLPQTKSPELMHLYGIGDHGGGPTREMLDTARRWQSPAVLYPRLRFSTAQSFFDDISKKLDTLTVPVWKNELYLEYHRGTYTTQAKTKQNNRRSETLMLNAEKLSSLASLFGRAYPQAELNDAWRKVLFNQFHDILPGSSIAPVYVDAARDQAEVRRAAGGILAAAMTGLAARIRTAGAPLVVFNPLAWERNDVVEVDVPLVGAPAAVTVRDPAGKTMLVEVVSRDEKAQSVRVRFLAEGVPSLGYKVFHVAAASAAQMKAPKAPPRVPFLPVVARADLLENDFWRVGVDAKSGCITSIFDKKFRREYLAPNSCGNLLQAFRDKPKDWDAWNIDADFENQKWDLTDAEEVKLVETGPVRAVIRVVRKFQNSRFVQNITLYAGIPRVDIRMEADWHEEHILIKAAVAVATKSDFATFEIPYGSIQRPATRNTPTEKAMFEVPALRWADISDENGGISLLNNSKYGHDVKDNVLRISLLRSPKWPDPNADIGHHEFTYSIYPHMGTWREAGTVRRGYELNTPLLAIATQAHTGSLPTVNSFISIEPADAIVTAIKKAEDDAGLIIRFYESGGRDTQVSLRLPPGAVRAVETNLMEKEEKELGIDSRGRLLIPTRAFEIKTVKVMFAPAVK